MTRTSTKVCCRSFELGTHQPLFTGTSDEDIVMPAGPPPSKSDNKDGDDDGNDDDDDDIPMPEGPPPGQSKCFQIVCTRF